MQRLLLLAGLLAAQPSMLVFAQNHAPSAKQIEPIETDFGGGVRVLSAMTEEQKKVFSIYVRPMKGHVYTQWIAYMPASARTPQSAKGTTAIAFTLNSDGSVHAMKLKQVSGTVALDRAAWGAITQTQFSPFPSDLGLQSLDLLFTFDYNLEKPRTQLQASH